MKTIGICILLAVLTSCTHVDYKDVARQAEPFRLMLVKYHELHGHFPGDPMLLKELDPQFDMKGGLWNGWDYASYDPDDYAIWTYPNKRSRQSLWLKFNIEKPSESGWFINNDDGNFEPQPITLLDAEQKLIQSKR